MHESVTQKIEIVYKFALILCPLDIILFFARMMLGVDLPGKAVEYNKWFASHQVGAIEIFGFFCAILADVLFIVSIIGMFFYFSKARYTFIIALTLFFISASLIPRPVLIDNIDSTSTYLSSIAAGVILAMSFLSPISERFKGGKSLMPNIKPK